MISETHFFPQKTNSLQRSIHQKSMNLVEESLSMLRCYRNPEKGSVEERGGGAELATDRIHGWRARGREREGKSSEIR